MVTQYEAMKQCREVLELLARNKVSMSDVLRMEVYEEWCRLRKEGHKITYIAYYLSRQYDMNESSVYRLVKRMERHFR